MQLGPKQASPRQSSSPRTRAPQTRTRPERARETARQPASAQEGQIGLRRVEYVSDSIMEKEDRFIRLLGGSSWELLAPSLALVMDDILIILTADDCGIAFVDKDEIPVVHRGGAYYAHAGYFSEVVQAMGDGAILRLSDGSLWSVPDYDQFDTGWWLPPYKVLVTADRLYMINLEEAKRVWVSEVR